MKTKTINAILCRKFDDWVSTITDEPLRELVKKDAVITGGAIASMLLREKVNDYDVYLRTHETARLLAVYYVDLFRAEAKKTTHGSGREVEMHVKADDGRVRVVVQSAGIAAEGGSSQYEYFESRPAEEADDYVEAQMTPAEDEAGARYRPVFISANAITLSHQIQVVLRFIGEPAEIHESYDFAHCTNFWESRERRVVLNQPALEALLTKELRYVGSLYPLCSIIRTRKFIQRGWSINAGQYLKMALQLGELNLTDPSVLEDQLTGVDYAYFAQVVAAAKEADPEKINATYLIAIVDRMF